MLLPRLCAMSEALWSPPSVKAWPDFKARLAPLMARLEEMGYRGRPLDA
jgi:hexosaminidase